MSSYIRPYRIGELELPGTSFLMVNERALVDWMNVDVSKKAVATAERLAESNYIEFTINILSSNRYLDIKSYQAYLHWSVSFWIRVALVSFLNGALYDLRYSHDVVSSSNPTSFNCMNAYTFIIPSCQPGIIMVSKWQ